MREVIVLVVHVVSVFLRLVQPGGVRAVWSNYPIRRPKTDFEYERDSLRGCERVWIEFPDITAGELVPGGDSRVPQPTTVCLRQVELQMFSEVWGFS
jgi:hypothetical protein